MYGVCEKSSDTHVEEYFDDLYILNTKTMVWKRVATAEIPPAKHNIHTCVSWKNKIIVIGGEDTQNYYMSDVQMLDTDTLTWTKLITNGELLPPRVGHTTVALGKNSLVFGGFTDAEDLYEDLYMFDLETLRWTKVITLGVGHLPDFLWQEALYIRSMEAFLYSWAAAIRVSRHLMTCSTYTQEITPA
ncbi:putative kelch-type beta propeller [Helianthus debilis subsp. tardiflorus]